MGTKNLKGSSSLKGLASGLSGRSARIAAPRKRMGMTAILDQMASTEPHVLRRARPSDPR
jgi:hypothetical protein